MLPAAQPFRPYLIDVLEPQRYPELKEKPYDITGWTLPMQMGVSVDRIDERFEADAGTGEASFARMAR